MTPSASRLTSQRIALYCRMRLASLLAPDELEHVRRYLDDCLTQDRFPPYRGQSIDLASIAETAGIDPRSLTKAKAQLQPICDAICRALADQPLSRPPPGKAARTASCRR